MEAKYMKMVRERGLEPPRLAAPDPKSGASANFAIPALPKRGLHCILAIFKL